MQRRGARAAAAACGLIGALALPTAALAATKTVYAGPPPATKKIAQAALGKAFGAKYSPDVNSFFMTRVTIHVGDAVAFKNLGFHTIDLPGSSGKDLPFIVPNGQTATGVNDAAGTPFWFNGHVPVLGPNPAVFAPTTKASYNGTKRVDSGLPTGPAAPKPMKVTFTKAGTYKYFCDVHPGMVGFVVVKPKSKRIPTAKQDAAALTQQITTIVASAKQLALTKVPAGQVSVGESNKLGLELFTMFPSTLTVNKGSVVTFAMSNASREVHTATFGPRGYLTSLANGFRGAVFPPAGIYPSSPVQPIALSASSHGNGFANTGAIDEDPATTQVPASGKIQFTQAGTYHYICLIHPFMQGTIVVH